MNSSLNDPAGDFCWCSDADLDKLRQLMAAGIEQIPASLMIWGNQGDEPTPLTNLSAWAQLRTVRRFAWYRPVLPRRSEAGATRDISGAVMLTCLGLFVVLAVWWGRFS